MHRNARFKLAVWSFFFFLALFVTANSLIEGWVGVPTYLHVVQGSSHRFSIGVPVSISAVRGNGGEITLNNQLPTETLSLSSSSSVVIRPVRTGKVRLNLRLFGLIPLRDRVVEVVSPVKVMPGGHSIGVLLAPHGMIVTGFAPLTDENGKTIFPARDAGLKSGDLITHLDNQIITGADQVAQLVNQRGRQGGWLLVRATRDGKVINFKVRPIPLPTRSSQQEKEYRLGVYLDDPAAGVGTLSFYDPKTKVFGALGHMITILNRRDRKDITEGRIVPASIAGIQPGVRGQPGEKVGVFHSRVDMEGRIEKNCSFGIYGRLMKLPSSGGTEAVDVAMSYEIRPGPAEVWTVIEGDRVERFDIEIIKVNRQLRPDGKGMVIRVTDDRLLQRTGGIVQGMSGSPIFQDGKMVGVVTHVFVNDPTRGYGILAEWMLVEAGLLPPPSTQKEKERAGPLPLGAAAFSSSKRGEDAAS